MASITLETLDTRITTVADALNQQARQLSLHVSDAESDINTINGQIRALQQEDTDLHRENHDLEIVVNSNEQRLTAVEADVAELPGDIQDVAQDVAKLQEDLEDMDVEHHEELHLLANAIDGHTGRLDTLELDFSAFPDMKVMSEAEYEALREPLPETFYFTYEE